MRPLSYHWHRFAEWARTWLAAHAFARGRHHHDRAMHHGEAADRICPPDEPSPF